MASLMTDEVCGACGGTGEVWVALGDDSESLGTCPSCGGKGIKRVFEE